MRKLQGVKLISAYYMDRFFCVWVNQGPNFQMLIGEINGSRFPETVIVPGIVNNLHLDLHTGKQVSCSSQASHFRFDLQVQ